jgi:hypothetical protein
MVVSRNSGKLIGVRLSVGGDSEHAVVDLVEAEPFVGGAMAPDDLAAFLVRAFPRLGPPMVANGSHLTALMGPQQSLAEYDPPDNMGAAEFERLAQCSAFIDRVHPDVLVARVVRAGAALGPRAAKKYLKRGDRSLIEIELKNFALKAKQAHLVTFGAKLLTEGEARDAESAINAFLQDLSSWSR